MIIVPRSSKSLSSNVSPAWGSSFSAIARICLDGETGVWYTSYGGLTEAGPVEGRSVKLLAWFKQHFAMGVILPSVISSLIAAFLFEWLKPGAISSPIGSIWNWLFAAIPIYRTTYWALIAYVIATLAAFAFRLAHTMTAERPDPRNYICDTFFGMVFRWTYHPLSNEIVHLAPHCPLCDRTLDFGDGYSTPVGTFNCREHGQIYRDSCRTIIEFKRVIEDEIGRRKHRNGEWKKIVEQQTLSSMQ